MKKITADILLSLTGLISLMEFKSASRKEQGSRLIEDSYKYYDTWKHRYGIEEDTWGRSRSTKPKDVIRFFINRLKEIEKEIKNGQGDRRKDYVLREEHGHISSYLQRIAFHLVDESATKREWGNAKTFRDYQLATIRYVLGLLNHAPSNAAKLHSDHKSAVMDLVEINALGFITDEGDVPDTQMVLSTKRRKGAGALSPISQNYRFKYMDVEPTVHSNFGYLSGFLKVKYLPIFKKVITGTNMMGSYDLEIAEPTDFLGTKVVYIRIMRKPGSPYITGSFMSDMVQLFRLVFEPNMMNTPNTQVIPFLQKRLRIN